MYKLNQNSVTRLADGASIPLADGNRDYEEYKQWISEGNIPELEFTEVELAQQLEDAKPKTVTMRQARLALLQAGLLTPIDTAIANGSDEAMKIEWEYATQIERNWSSLITLTTAMGMTSEQLDDLFLLASAL